MTSASLGTTHGAKIMFKRQRKNNVETSAAYAHINADGTYNLSFGITRLMHIDLFDLNQALIQHKISRDLIVWGTPDRKLEALYYASK
jgi:hypothetical protein